MLRSYFLILAMILFLYGLYMLFTGRYWMWFARSYYLFAEGNLVRWLGLSIITFTGLFGISLISIDLFKPLLPYTLLALFITSIIGLVMQSRAELIKKDAKK